MKGLEKASRNPKYTDILRSTAGVVFLGTPLRGTRVASIAGWIALLRELMHKETSETLLQGLRENANSLDNMVHHFAMMTIENKLQIRCFYETRKTQVATVVSRTLAGAFGIAKVEVKFTLVFLYEYLLLISLQKLVPRESACLDCHQRIALDLRHAMMNKFRGPEDVNFKIVASSLKELAENARLARERTPTEMRCLESLASNYRDHKNRNRQRVPGTCEWLLTNQKFKAWRQKEGNGLLWVSADPGCGKSVLSRALIDEGLLSNVTRAATVCYFFFKDDDSRRRTEADALCALLHQLFIQKSALLKHGLSRFESHGASLSANVSQLWDIFINAARDSGAGHIICVLDALDESKRESARNITSQLGRLYNNRNVGKTAVKFLVTSRPYAYIGTDFNSEIEDMTSISLRGEEESDKISSEINLVIRHEVPKLAKAREPPLKTQVQENLIERLTTIPHRTYLWLHLILEEIREDLSSTSTGLGKIIGSMPRSIEEAYETILVRVEKRGFASQARRLLHVVLGAEMPLTLAEMNNAMAIDDEIVENGCFKTYKACSLEPEDAFRVRIRNLCGLFVSIAESRIYLIHQTAKNFLVQTQPCNIPRSCLWKGSFDPVESNMIILKICISYILSEELAQPVSAENMKYFRNKIKPDIDFIRYDEDEDEDEEQETFEETKDEDEDEKEKEEEKLRKHSKMRDSLELYRVRGPADVPPIYNLLEYAANYWFLHFRKAKSSLDESVVQLVLKVCDARTIHFKNWWSFLQLYSDLHYKPDTDLAVAATLGLDTIIKLLLAQKDIDVNSKNKWGETPLHFGVSGGNVEVVRLLLAQKDIDLNSKNKWSYTPLCKAASRGRVEVVKLLLARKDIEFNSTNDYHQTPLSLAVQEGHVEIVRLLLAHKTIDLNPALNKRILHRAIDKGVVEVVRLLLTQESIDVNLKNELGQTPLHVGILNRSVGIVRMLLERDGVEKSNDDGTGVTPLLHALKWNALEIVKLLLKDKDVDPNTSCRGWNPLLVAVDKGNEELVKLLLAGDRVMPLHGNPKVTPFQCAMKRQRKKILALLLKAKGVKLFMVNFTKKTPYWVVYDARGTVEIIFLKETMEDLICWIRDSECENEIVSLDKHPCLSMLQVLLEKTSFEKVISGDGCLLRMRRRCDMLIYNRRAPPRKRRRFVA